MKKLFIKIKAKRYDEAIERAKSLVDFCSDSELKTLEYVFPELKEELEDEKIRKALIFDYRGDDCLCTKEYRIDFKDIRAWLEKQGNTNETIDRDEFAQGVLRGAAINLITWIDYNAAKGNMCLSNMECKDIEDALVSGDWDKIYAYMKKKLEKQGEQNHDWSEEDERNLEFVISKLKIIIDEKHFAPVINWLKSLRPQSHWKPSNKQMNALDSTLQYGQISHNSFEHLNSLFNDLQKLREE